MGWLTFILSLALQFALVVRSSCGFSTTCTTVFGSEPLRWGHPSGVEAVSVLDRNEGLVCSLFNWLVRVSAMSSPFWVETVLCLILDRNEDFADFLSSWFRAFAMGSPF